MDRSGRLDIRNKTDWEIFEAIFLRIVFFVLRFPIIIAEVSGDMHVGAVMSTIHALIA